MELAGQVAGDLGRGVVDGALPAAMPGPGPGLAQPGGALAGQLDLDRDPLGERVDVLAVQPGAGRSGGVVGELDGGVGDVALAGLTAQLPLRLSQRPPSGMLGSRARRTTPTAWTWASWGMTKDQARTSRPTSRTALAVGATHWIAEQPVSSDQAAVLPTAQDLAQGLLAQLPRDLRRAGRQPAEQHPEHVGAGGVLLAQPAQGGHISLGDAGVNVPTRTPGAAVPGSGAARWRSVAGAVDLWAGSSAASTIEALIRHRGRPPAGEPPLGVLARRPGGRGTQPRRRR